MSDDEVEIKANLSKQLDELEMLQSIFSKPGEILFDEPSILEDIKAYITECGGLKPSSINFKINLAEQNLELAVTLPHNYPSEEPEIFIRNFAWSKKQHSVLNQDCKKFLTSLPRGEECLYSVVTWLQENSRVDLEKTSDNDDSPATPKELVRMWIYSHHIYNKTKRREILNLANSLNITGFCMPGKPGVICIEGEARDCNEWWQTIKAMTWQRIVCRVTEACTKLETFLKFKNFEEVAFTTGGSRSNHANIGELNKYLQEHQLGYIFKEIFGVDGNVDV